MSEELTGAAEAAIPTNDVAPAAAPDTPAAAPETAQEAPETSWEDDLSAVYDKATSEPLRGPDGKFASPNKPETVEGETPPVEAQTEDQTSPETETPEPATPAIEPPVSWSREMRDKWPTLPPEAQQYIAQRESEAHSQISRLGQQVKSFDPVAKTLEQYRSTFERNGMGYADGLNALLAAQSMLDTDPRTAIQHLAQAYGVDLSGAQPAADAPSRETIALRSELAELKRQVAETRTDVNSRKVRDEQDRIASIQSEVDAFAKANPYFNEVENDVVAQIQVLRIQNPELSERQLLAKAYKHATKINEAVSAKLEAEKKAKETAEAKQKAEAAKKVSSLNVKSNTAARPAAKTIDDDLNATWDRIHSRAS